MASSARVPPPTQAPDDRIRPSPPSPESPRTSRRAAATSAPRVCRCGGGCWVDRIRRGHLVDGPESSGARARATASLVPRRSSRPSSAARNTVGRGRSRSCTARPGNVPAVTARGPSQAARARSIVVRSAKPIREGVRCFGRRRGRARAPGAYSFGGRPLARANPQQTAAPPASAAEPPPWSSSPIRAQRAAPPCGQVPGPPSAPHRPARA